MQRRHRLVQRALHGNNEGRVMLFGGLDRCVAKQELDGSEVGTVGKEGHRECVAKAVRVAVDHLGKIEQAIDGSPSRADGARELGSSAPEKVRRFNRKGRECVKDNLRQSEVQRCTCLHHADEQLTCLHVDLGTRQLYGIGDAKSRVEQRRHQGPCAEAGALDFALVRIIDQIDGIEDLLHFLVGEWHRRRQIRFWRIQVGRWVLRNPIARGAEVEEGTHRLNFFERGVRSERPGPSRLTAIRLERNLVSVARLMLARFWPGEKVARWPSVFL